VRRAHYWSEQAALIVAGSIVLIDTSMWWLSGAEYDLDKWTDECGRQASIQPEDHPQIGRLFSVSM
jgi:hypothetical protein